MYDLDEQQQLEIIKAWLRRHGNKLAAALLVAAIAGGAFAGYQRYEHKQDEKASMLYAELTKMKDEKDVKKIRLAASNIMENFGKTPYAARAALYAAARDFDSGEMDDARIQLQWVLDHSQEPELKDVARLRLARVLFDQKKYGDAVAALDEKHGDSFDGLYSDLKGDIFLAEGKKDQARSAYLLALVKIDKASPYRDLVSIKLDSTGGGK